jgi:hypothetical protein
MVSMGNKYFFKFPHKRYVFCLLYRFFAHLFAHSGFNSKDCLTIPQASSLTLDHAPSPRNCAKDSICALQSQSRLR